MTNINNGYKRFINYRTADNNNRFKENFMEQNYKVEKSLGDKKSLPEKKELSKPDNSFLKNATRLEVNSGKFVKK